MPLNKVRDANARLECAIAFPGISLSYPDDFRSGQNPQNPAKISFVHVSHFLSKTLNNFTDFIAKSVKWSRKSLQRKEWISRPERSALPG
jgi:hypothetical protein